MAGHCLGWKFLLFPPSHLLAVREKYSKTSSVYTQYDKRHPQFILSLTTPFCHTEYKLRMSYCIFLSQRGDERTGKAKISPLDALWVFICWFFKQIQSVSNVNQNLNLELFSLLLIAKIFHYTNYFHF